jgi:PIN domain nuclease of toxin-antitoxin system
VRLLLDTQAFLWFVGGDRRLSRPARRRIEDARNDKFLSIASVWEMAIKLELGKLRIDVPMPQLVQVGAVDNGLALLAIEPEHAIGVATLERHHGDPFDRMLIVQARHEDMVIVGADEQFDAYGVRRIW